jgi:hypothetical protein
MASQTVSVIKAPGILLVTVPAEPGAPTIPELQGVALTALDVDRALDLLSMAMHPREGAR